MEWINLRDIYDYFCCPYRIYLKDHVGLKQGILSEVFKYGKREEERVKKILKEKYRNKIQFDVYFESKKLGLRGILDALISNGNDVTVVDIKAGDKIHEWYRKYVVAMAVLVENCLNKIVKEGIIYLSEIDREVRIRVKDFEKREIIESIDKIREIIRGKIPKKKEGSWCDKCEFRDFCKNY